MHDDQPGGVPQNGHEGPFTRVTMRHFDKPISARELLHGTLDRLLDELINQKETMGAVSVTNLDGTDEEGGGRTFLLCLDLDPDPARYEGMAEGDEE